jgi:hypothetical protein
MIIGEALDIGFAGDAQRSAFGAGTGEETFPLGIRSHIAPQGFAEQFAHGAVFAGGDLLGFDEEVGWQGNGDGFGGTHSGHCETLTSNVKQGAGPQNGESRWRRKAASTHSKNVGEEKPGRTERARGGGDEFQSAAD